MVARLFVNGKWTEGIEGRKGEILDPANNETIGEICYATAADIDEALAGARSAFESWRQRPALERSRILRRAADLTRDRAEAMAVAVTAEMGKPIGEARFEAGSVGDHIDWYAEECRRAYGRVIPSRIYGATQMALKEPIGPVAAFSPWNFPLGQLVRKIAGALAAGCTIIAKAPEECPTCCIELVRCFEDAGVPAGALTLLFGNPAEISTQLISSPVIRKVSFTGSVPVGRQLGALAARHIKPATLELGGHAPFIVDDDVELDSVVKLGVGLKYRNAGQVCAAPTRYFVTNKHFDAFLDAFVEGSKAIKVGDGMAVDTDMGPLAHSRRFDAMQGFVEDALACGADLKCGGERVGNRGNFFAPTVLANVPVNAKVMTDEPFGPIAVINRVETIDEAIEAANSLPYGLAAFAFSRSLATANRFAREIEAGMVSINHFGLAAPETPFGGVKDSGYGSEGGSEGLEAYFTTRFVSQMAS